MALNAEGRRPARNGECTRHSASGQTILMWCSSARPSPPRSVMSISRGRDASAALILSGARSHSADRLQRGLVQLATTRARHVGARHLQPRQVVGRDVAGYVLARETGGIEL